MIICSNCQHENIPGTLFCVECGAQLDDSETLTTQAVTQSDIANDLEDRSASVEPPSSPVNSWISLHLMDSGKILPLTSRTEFTMGRLSEGQPIMPDIDLTPYQAYASGVSRLHAVVKREADRTIVAAGESGRQEGKGRTVNIRVFLVDDHQILLAALRTLLEKVPGIEVSGIANEVPMLFKALAETSPDVVVMDLGMPGIGGLEATRRLIAEYPKIKVVVLSGCLNSLKPES